MVAYELFDILMSFSIFTFLNSVLSPEILLRDKPPEVTEFPQVNFKGFPLDRGHEARQV